MIAPQSAAATPSSQPFTATPPAGQSIVVVDPQPVMLNALVSQLPEAGFTVLGSAIDRQSAVALVNDARPDAMVIGAERIESDDAEFYAELRAKCPDLKIVVYCTSDDRHAMRAVQNGADAFVQRSAPIADLLLALRQMKHRTIYLRDPARAGGPHSLSSESTLSVKQAEVLQLAADGLSTRAIAERLGVTEQTVKFHLGNAYKKLGVKNRAQAVRWVMERS